MVAILFMPEGDEEYALLLHIKGLKPTLESLFTSARSIALSTIAAWSPGPSLFSMNLATMTLNSSMLRPCSGTLNAGVMPRTCLACWRWMLFTYTSQWFQRKRWKGKWQIETHHHIDDFVQDCSISTALTMEILQSCHGEYRFPEKNLNTFQGLFPGHFRSFKGHFQCRSRCIAVKTYTVTRQNLEFPCNLPSRITQNRYG